MNGAAGGLDFTSYPYVIRVIDKPDAEHNAGRLPRCHVSSPLPTGTVGPGVLAVLGEPGVEIVRPEGGAVADDQKVHPGAGHRHVHPAVFREEAHRAFGIGSGEPDHHDVPLLALESIDGLDGQPAFRSDHFAVEQILEQGDLGAVGRDDPDRGLGMGRHQFPDAVHREGGLLRVADAGV